MMASYISSERNPMLEILTQPPEFNRFRYPKERLNNTLKDEGKYPTVILKNVSEAEAVVRVRLCEKGENGTLSPHTAFHLDDKSTCEVKVPPPLYTAEFNYLRITFLREENEVTPVKNVEKPQKSSSSKHVVYLVFEAFYERDTQRAEPICGTVSREIKNGGHVSTNSLSIKRILPSFGYSGSEIALLTTKVKKDDIEVSFSCHQGVEGVFTRRQTPGYVHYQSAIVVQVPNEFQEVISASYQDRLKVDISLYRPSTETWSRPRTFTVLARSQSQLQSDMLVPSDTPAHPATTENLAPASVQSHTTVQSHSTVQSHTTPQNSQTSPQHLMALPQYLTQTLYTPSPHPLAPPPYTPGESLQDFFQLPFQTASQHVHLTPHLGDSMPCGDSPDWASTQQGWSLGNPSMPSPSMPWPTTSTTPAQQQGYTSRQAIVQVPPPPPRATPCNSYGTDCSGRWRMVVGEPHRRPLSRLSPQPRRCRPAPNLHSRLA